MSVHTAQFQTPVGVRVAVVSRQHPAACAGWSQLRMILRSASSMDFGRGTSWHTRCFRTAIGPVVSQHNNYFLTRATALRLHRALRLLSRSATRRCLNMAHELLNSVAATTTHRDRDELGRAVARLLLQFLQTYSVTLLPRSIPSGRAPFDLFGQLGQIQRFLRVDGNLDRAIAGRSPGLPGGGRRALRRGRFRDSRL
jgi:hypothetical protein